MIQQLRIYQVNPDLKDEFEVRFREHALRIMKTYEFEINSMWFSEHDDMLQFVYILSWPDEITLQRQWEAFMNDTEWKDIKRASLEQHGEMVLSKVRDQVLNPLSHE